MLLAAHGDAYSYGIVVSALAPRDNDAVRFPRILPGEVANQFPDLAMHHVAWELL